MPEAVNSLQVLTTARRMLAEAKSLDDLRQIRDLAEAARAYAQVAKLGLESQNEAAEIKLRAERRSGEMLTQMEKNKGAAEEGWKRPEGGDRAAETSIGTLLPLRTLSPIIKRSSKGM